LKAQLNGRLPWELKSRILGMRGSEWSPIVIQYFLTHYGVGDGTAGNEPLSPSKLWGQWETNLSTLCANVRAMKGAPELVEELRKNQVPMAIATSSQQDAVEVKRGGHENTIFGKMKVVVTGDDPAVRRGKPHPDIFLEAASRLGVPPTECLVFEDSMTGIMAGKAAGCQVVAVPDLRSDMVEFLEVADVVLRSLEEFDGKRFGINVELAKKTAAKKQLSRRESK